MGTFGKGLSFGAACIQMGLILVSKGYKNFMFINGTNNCHKLKGYVKVISKFLKNQYVKGLQFFKIEYMETNLGQNPPFET